MSDPANSTLASENRKCPGCKKSVVTEDGGVVVAFGQSFFHVDCFRCAKCNDQVTADTNLLLLSDGSPVCANCSYCCNVCGQPILDEAIMTGDDSYHAHCFNCKVCKKRIDELVFAKTTQGIYCMDCHNERVARSRRHQQRQREREKEKARERAAIDSGSSKPRDYIPKEPVPTGASQNGRPGSNHSQGRPNTPRSSEQGSAGSSRADIKRVSISSLGEKLHNPHSPISTNVSSDSHSSGPGMVSLPPTAASSSKKYASMLLGRPSSPSTRAPDAPQQNTLSSSTSAIPPQDHLRSASSPAPQMSSLAVPSLEDSKSSPALQKRRSFDDRPMNILLKENEGTNVANVSQGSLLSPEGGTSRRAKRQSINPSIGLMMGSSNQSGMFSPVSPTSPNSGPIASSSSSPAPSRDYSRVSTPLRDQFPMDFTMSPPPIIEGAGTVTVEPPSYTQHLQQHINGRSRSASSATFADQARDSFQLQRPPVRPSMTLDRVPARTSSRTGHAGADGYRSSSQMPDGRSSPGLAVPNGLRHQKSFDDRMRPAASSLRNSTASLGQGQGQTIEVPASMSRSHSPTSPSHRVDVPRGIESGTDTEGESEEASRAAARQSSGDGTSTNDSRTSLPPLPPPKDGTGKGGRARSHSRPPRLSLDTAGVDADHDNSELSQLDSEDADVDVSEMSHDESSPVQRTSRTTYITPALPPLRISMGGADFSDLLKSVGGAQGLKSLGELREASPIKEQEEEESNRTTSTAANNLKVDVTLTPPPGGKFGSGQVMTPKSDVTVLGPLDPNVDPNATPVKRREPRAEQAIERTPSASTNASVSSKAASRAQAQLRDSGTDVSSDWSHIQAPARPSLDSQSYSLSNGSNGRDRSASASSSGHSAVHVTVTSPENSTHTTKMGAGSRANKSELVRRRLQEAVKDATARGAPHVKLDMEFVGAILELMEKGTEDYNDIKHKFDGMKRASQQYMDGLTVAQTEYDKELKARRDAEAEVTRLRVLLSGQAVQLTAMSGETKRQEVQKQLSREISDSLSTLERDLSKLKVQRDMTLAEVEELSATKSMSSMADNGDVTAAKLGRALSTRFDNIKSQYQHQLVPLTEEREILLREIAELKASRDAVLEETTILNARNEELAQLHAQYIRRVPDGVSNKHEQDSGSRQSHENMRANTTLNLTASTTSSTVAHSDESSESKFVNVKKPDVAEVPVPQTRAPKVMKWLGSKAPNFKENVAAVWHEAIRPKNTLQHTFQQASVLRVTRCDHCGDKMWGSSLRCSNCNISVHTRCVQQVHLPCSHQSPNSREELLPALAVGPSMFGRDLSEQARADSRDQERVVPVIVEKCIDAVDHLALEYEGIYRKTGGSRLCKVITQLFERGDYDAFDLRDTEQFNDICSITSVLKTYFRALPDPLLTYALHDKFVAATSIRDEAMKASVLTEIVNELPTAHYYTTRALMLHLHRIRQHSDKNLMHARNLGVVFGPTLMRSRDPNAEFSDMAGKALSVEWLVDHAPAIFDQPTTSPP